MSIKAWRLPWRGAMVPHAVVDVLRGCNISCRTCYNGPPTEAPKTVAQIREELDGLLKLRRLSSISILGGEVSIHPQLCDIVRAIRERDLYAEIFTNGFGVDRSMCRNLKNAGLSIIYFHIERGQVRPDLPEDHSADDLNRLRLEKAVMATEEGLDVGLAATAYPGEMEDIRDLVSFTLETPEINYLLFTLFRDNSSIESLRGDIYAGFSGTGAPPPEPTRQNNRLLAALMRKEFDLEPFAYMGSSLDPEDPRWLSYLVGTVYEPDGRYHVEYIQPSLVEKISMMLSRLFKGRYPMYLKQNPSLFRKQLVLNGLTGGRRRSNRELVNRSARPGTRLTAKRILFQNPAELTRDGRLIHCKWCPDAILKNGTLVPVCIADNIS